MSNLISSGLKTWLRRNGFRNEGYRVPLRACYGYLQRSGRNFRIRESDNEVDIGELHETFDRWANSIARTISLEEFKKEFAR